MNEAFRHGLYLTVAGMGLVFLALGILLGLSILLERLFRPRQSSLTEPAAEPAEEDITLAAAIGLALALEDSVEHSGSVPSTARVAAGGWTVAGRSRQVTGWRRTRRANR